MKEIEFVKKIVDWFKALSTTQLAVGGTATALVVAGVIGGVALSDALGTSGEGVGTEGTEGSTYATESLFPGIVDTGETQTTEETEMTEVTEVTEEEVEITVRIKYTSIERDLKLKIVDEDGDLVKGFPFVVNVRVKGEDAGTDYTDEDMDGIIHIKDIEGGEYKILLQELEGIIIKKNNITAKVKGQIEYEKIEIEDEIQDESEINVSVEDTASNDVVVEAPIVDTLALVESTVTTTTVPKENVDVSKMPVATVGENKEYTLEQHEKVENEGDTGSGGNTETGGDTGSGGDTGTGGDAGTSGDAGTGDDTAEGTETEETETGTESVTGQDGGSAEVFGFSFGTTGVTNTTSKVKATATVRFPGNVTLYLAGGEASTSAELILEIEDDSKLIQKCEWSIKDTTIATLGDVGTSSDSENETGSETEGASESDDKLSKKVTALAEGKTVLEVKITYISDANGVSTNVKTIQCEINVTKHTDKTTQLVDVNGNLLYLDNRAEKIATPKDYDKATEFYTNPKYTGWQTFDGYLYYYTTENVPATGAQTIGGVSYEFHEDGTLKESEQSIGIDVSKWNQKIDWKTVANAGIDFAIIRCAYRGATTGKIVEDPYFRDNIKGATENGIKVGVYFFTQAITEAEAVEEASTAVALVSGYKLHFPIFIDTENANNGRANGLGRAERTAIVKAFCETVRNSGYKPGIYASKYWYYDNLDESQLSTYNIWVAQYNTSCNYRGRYDMWQYTSKGSVPGIKGNVDMNYCYTKY